MVLEDSTCLNPPCSVAVTDRYAWQWTRWRAPTWRPRHGRYVLATQLTFAVTDRYARAVDKMASTYVAAAALPVTTALGDVPYEFVDWTAYDANTGRWAVRQGERGANDGPDSSSYRHFKLRNSQYRLFVTAGYVVSTSPSGALTLPVTARD